MKKTILIIAGIAAAGVAAYFLHKHFTKADEKAGATNPTITGPKLTNIAVIETSKK